MMMVFFLRPANGIRLMKLKAEDIPMFYALVIIFLIGTVLFFSMKGVAMTMFSGKEEEVVLFSPMEGKLTFEGRPAVGAKITRNVSWRDNVGETDNFYADKNGHFNLPIKSQIEKMSPLFQFVAHQKIFVYFEGKEYQIWGNGKLDKAKYTEFGGQPKNLHCELTQEPDRVDTKNGWVVTSCEWNLED